MRSHLAIWLSVALGGAAYQIGKHYFGFHVNPEDWTASVYWTGVALLSHRMANGRSRIATR